MSDDNNYRLDRTIIAFDAAEDGAADREYWRTKTVQERLQAVEYLRQQVYGYDATARVQRVLTISWLGEDDE